jgi:hypothetical protein
MKKVISLTILLFLIITFYSIIIGCSKEETNLSPARNIEGTWKTSFVIPHKIKTDFCSANLKLVATQDRIVTLIITKGTDDNHVNVEYKYTGSNFKNINTNCTFGTGYTPDVSPNFYKGTISSTSLLITDSKNKTIGNFSFTTDLMEGTWNDNWCIGFCQAVYTDTNQLKLIKQK